MEKINFIIAIGSFLLAVIGINFDKIYEKFRHLFSKKDLIGESIFVVYDVLSRDKTINYQTTKYKVKKYDPKLIVEHSCEYGNSEEITTKVDNKNIQIKYLEKDTKTKQLTYKLFDKNIGDTIVVDDHSSYLLDANSKEQEDSLGVLISPYRYKDLTIQLIFPEGFTPLNLKFEKLIYKKEKVKIKNMKNIPKLLVSYSNNRKLIQWRIKYPRFKHHYRIAWTWNK